MSENGGIGRHARLRTLWPLGCGGSTPPSRTLLFFLFIVNVVGCANAPDDVVRDVLNHLQKSGDSDEICSLVTAESCTWLRGMKALRTTEETPPKQREKPFWEIVHVDILEDGLEIQMPGKSPYKADLALVHVQFEEGSPTVFAAVKQRNMWVLDLFATGDVWTSLRPFGLSDTHRAN